jgi:hypothetical protein
VPMDLAVLFSVCEPAKLGSPIAKSNHCLRRKANLYDLRFGTVFS